MSNIWGQTAVSSDTLYWVEGATGKIQRANVMLDSAQTQPPLVEDMVTGLRNPTDLAIDPLCRQMYWVSSDQKIQKANFDGTHIKDVVPTQGIATSIALDVGARRIYWADGDGIHRTSFDRGFTQDILLSLSQIQILGSATGIALDVTNNKLYWTDLIGNNQSNRIMRATLDGAHIEALVTQGLVEPRSITLCPFAGCLPGRDIAIDVRAGITPNDRKLYWANGSTSDPGQIVRANLDGSEITEVVTGIGRLPAGVVLLFNSGHDTSSVPIRAFPAQGGTPGSVTVSLNTSFLEGTTVKLTRTGEADITGIVRNATAEGASCQTLVVTFDLTGQAQGQWDVVVENPDGTSIPLPAGFTVEPRREARVWVDVAGLDRIQPGRPQKYYVAYGNSGNVDAVGVPLAIAGPKNAFTLNFGIAPPPILPGQESIDWNQIPVHVETNTGLVVPLVIPRISPGPPGALSLTLNFPATEVNLQHLQAWTNPPLFSSPLSSKFIHCMLEVIRAVSDIVFDDIPFAGCATAVANPLFDLFITGEALLNRDNRLSLAWWVTSLFR
jgi:hypothetical protein